MSVERRLESGESEILYRPSNSVIRNLCSLLSSLSLVLEPEKGRNVECVFDTYFAKGNTEISRVLVRFLQQEFGGDESKVVRVIKVCPMQS
jgi:hypothetical protein